jgi:hypothetical protein
MFRRQKFKLPLFSLMRFFVSFNLVHPSSYVCIVFRKGLNGLVPISLVKCSRMVEKWSDGGAILFSYKNGLFLIVSINVGDSDSHT